MPTPENGDTPHEQPAVSPESKTFPDALGFGTEIDALAERNIVRGWDDGTFRPTLSIQRQAAIALIWRALGEPQPQDTTSGFDDVPPGHPFEAAITWAAEQDIAQGWPDGTFRPGLPVHRDAFVTFMWRASGKVSPVAGTGRTFNDVTSAHDFFEAIDWAVKSGIIQGWSQNTFRPSNEIERQAAAAMLARWQWFVPRPTQHQFDSECLQRQTSNLGPAIRITGPRNTRSVLYSTKQHTVYDARGAAWDGRNATGSGSGVIRWPVMMRGKGPFCWVGGRYRGAWDHADENIWSAYYHESALIGTGAGNVLVEGMAGRHIGDGLVTFTTPGSSVAQGNDRDATGFKFRSNYLQYIGDDCIQNDDLLAGTYEDNFFEHCYMGISAKPVASSKLTTTDAVLRYQNNLMSLGHFDFPYKWWETYRGCAQGGHAAFFKVGEPNQGMNWALNNNIFYIENDSCGVASELGIWPSMNLTECNNNTIVWAGEGPPPFPSKPNRPTRRTTIPDCFKITTDRAVWDNAVAHWKATHPGIRP